MLANLIIIRFFIIMLKISSSFEILIVLYFFTHSKFFFHKIKCLSTVNGNVYSIYRIILHTKGCTVIYNARTKKYIPAFV